MHRFDLLGIEIDELRSYIEVLSLCGMRWNNICLDRVRPLRSVSSREKERIRIACQSTIILLLCKEDNLAKKSKFTDQMFIES